MPGLTRVMAFTKLEDAKAEAKALLNDGNEVAITGKTAVVQLRNGDAAPIYWSAGDPGDVYVVIASQDGVAELKLNAPTE